MKDLFQSLIVCIVLFSSCSNEPSNTDSNETEPIENYDAGIDDDIISHELELERELEKEQTHPSEYLVLKSACKKNLKGEWILKGTLENTATQATYSNIQLTAEYFDKLDSVITNSDEQLNSTIAPNQTIELKYTLSQKPKKAKKAEVKIKL